MAVVAHILLQQDASRRPLRDGLAEERKFRTLLGSTGMLDVLYTDALDQECAIDALVTVKGAPQMSPVGIQFTLTRNSNKKRRAISTFRQTRSAPRFLYLRCTAPLTSEALNPLMWLILSCAGSDDEHAIASAVLVLDSDGRHVLEGIRHHPINPQPLD
jgi:hypothetical protein